MTFTVYVQTQRWRAHHQQVLAELPGLVPVAKGNGYGVGNDRLAREASHLGVDTVAVGTEREVAQIMGQFAGDVLVLTPLLAGAAAKSRPEAAPDAAPDAASGAASRTIRTVAHADVLESLPTGHRIVIECRTSMHRHGLQAGELADVTGRLGRSGAQVEGLALHFPLDRPDGVDLVAETEEWVARLQGTSLPTRSLWVSHLSAAELAGLRERHPEVTFRPRVGTRLWLGDREALGARGTVLDVEPLRRGERCGYRQHRAPSGGHLVVVSGGTAHGVALEAPRAVRGPVQRAKVLALGTLEAVGRNLSPFRWAGRQRWFIEPPHMQVSLVFVPAAVAPPTVGEELECAVRLTTTHADRVRDI